MNNFCTIAFLIYLALSQPTIAFSTLTPIEAKAIIDSNDQLIIIDCRSCVCSYREWHIDGALWSKDPSEFYNTTKDCFVYGESAIWFCEDLSAHTNANVYTVDDYLELRNLYSERQKSGNIPYIIIITIIISIISIVILFIRKRQTYV